MTTMASAVPPGAQHWPSLGDTATQDEWEMVAPEEFECQRVVDVVPRNPKILKHAASSPDLRRYVIDVSEDDDTDAVVVENKSIMSQDASSAVLVSAPPSVASTVSKVSFRDAILKSQNTGSTKPQDATQTTQPQRKFKAKFVVKPISRCAKSAPNLHALEEEEVLGDTDAHEYYSRKSMGAAGRQNGLKIRPDEAKRLQMTLNKKSMQKQSQRN